MERKREEEREREMVSGCDSVGVLERRCGNTAYQRKRRREAGAAQRTAGPCEERPDDRRSPLVSYLALTLKGHPSLIDPPRRDKRRQPALQQLISGPGKRWMGWRDQKKTDGGGGGMEFLSRANLTSRNSNYATQIQFKVPRDSV